MADENLATDPKSDEAPVAQPSQPGRLKTYGLYAAIAVAMLGAAYLVTAKVVKPMFAKSAATAEKETPAPEKAKPEAEAKKEESGGHEAAAPEESAEGGKESNLAGNIFMMKDIIVNPAGTGGTRFLSAAVGFELKNPQAGGRITEREAVVRDALITILSSQTIAELTDPTQRERVRRLIQKRICDLLQTTDIGAVYFTEFVLQ